MRVLAIALALFASTAQAQVQTYAGGPYDQYNNWLMRWATYTGGDPNFVNAVLKVQTNIAASALSSEWPVLSIVNSWSATSTGVSFYGQANNYGTGIVWAGVDEAHCYTFGGTCVGREIDVGGVAGSNPVGIDFVKTNATASAFVRAEEDTPLLRDAAAPGTYMMFHAGHIQFFVNNVLVGGY